MSGHRRPSRVTTVHPSANSCRTRAPGDHRLDGERDARDQSRARPGRPWLSTCGSWCISVPMPCPRSLDDAVPAAPAGAVRHGVRDARWAAVVAGRPPRGAAMPAHSASSATSARACSSGGDLADPDRDAASPCHPSTIAPQSMEIRSPSGAPRPRRDAVHDLLVDRGADRAGKAVVAQERRDAARLADGLLGRGADLVELSRVEMPPGPDGGLESPQRAPDDEPGASAHAAGHAEPSLLMPDHRCSSRAPLFARAALARPELGQRGRSASIARPVTSSTGSGGVDRHQQARRRSSRPGGAVSSP